MERYIKAHPCTEFHTYESFVGIGTLTKPEKKQVYYPPKTDLKKIAEQDAEFQKETEVPKEQREQNLSQSPNEK